MYAGHFFGLKTCSWLSFMAFVKYCIYCVSAPSLYTESTDSLIGQTRHQSTPLYLYIQNIKLVCNSGTLCAGMKRENVVYT